MNDLISRQAAIDALCEMRCGCVLSSCPLTLDKDGTEECADVRCLMDLPSAQPEPCEDAVSRQQVLEEFAELFMICNETLPNENGHRYVVEKELLITQKHIEKLPSAQPDRSLWFRIGEICVDESKGFITAGRAFEKIRELLREAERRTDGSKV